MKSGSEVASFSKSRSGSPARLDHKMPSSEPSEPLEPLEWLQNEVLVVDFGPFRLQVELTPGKTCVVASKIAAAVEPVLELVAADDYDRGIPLAAGLFVIGPT